MTQLGACLTHELLRAPALALLHFLWQGLALAAVAGLVFSLTRRAQLRYLAGVALLVLMVAAPVVTTKVILQRDSATGAAVAGDATSPLPAQTAPVTRATSQSPAPSQPGTLVWLVELWTLGVLLFSLRAVGGVILLERLRRKSAVPFTRPPSWAGFARWSCCRHAHSWTHAGIHRRTALARDEKSHRRPAGLLAHSRS